MRCVTYSFLFQKQNKPFVCFFVIYIFKGFIELDLQFMYFKIGHLIFVILRLKESLIIIIRNFNSSFEFWHRLFRKMYGLKHKIIRTLISQSKSQNHQRTIKSQQKPNTVKMNPLYHLTKHFSRIELNRWVSCDLWIVHHFQVSIRKLKVQTWISDHNRTNIVTILLLILVYDIKITSK